MIITRVMYQEWNYMQINELLKLLIEKGASDLHLIVASPPAFRIDGKIVPQTDFAPLSQKETEEIFNVIATREQRDNFYRKLELDFAYSIPGISRYGEDTTTQFSAPHAIEVSHGITTNP